MKAGHQAGFFSCAVAVFTGVCYTLCEKGDVSVLHTVMAFLPLAFLIVYALKTRKMADAMVLATLLAVLLVHRQHFFAGLIDAMYTTLGNSSYQFALCSILGFGGMISLFQASGGLMGFRDLLAKAANTPRKTLLLAWLLSVIMFVDEYLNALTTTICLRGVSDKTVCPGAPGGADQHYGMLPVRDGALYQLDGIQRGSDLRLRPGVHGLPSGGALHVLSAGDDAGKSADGVGLVSKVGMLRQAYHRVASGGSL